MKNNYDTSRVIIDLSSMKHLKNLRLEISDDCRFACDIRLLYKGVNQLDSYDYIDPQAKLDLDSILKYSSNNSWKLFKICIGTLYRKFKAPKKAEVDNNSEAFTQITNQTSQNYQI